MNPKDAPPSVKSAGQNITTSCDEFQNKPTGGCNSLEEEATQIIKR